LTPLSARVPHAALARRLRRANERALRPQRRHCRTALPTPSGTGTEVARYTISSGTRALVRYGSGPAGSLWDEPVDGHGDRYLVEPRVDYASLPHLLADYLEQSRLRDCPAMIVDLGPGTVRRHIAWPPTAAMVA
jgi:hypothetical protein